MDPTTLSNENIHILYSFEDMDDERLVLAAQSGEDVAFSELRRRHADRILRSTYRIMKNWEDSEDVLQESFLKAYIHLREFEGRSSFSSWVTRIAINSALMTLRRRRNRPEMSMTSTNDRFETGWLWEPQDFRDNPERRYLRDERVELLKRAILRLPLGTRDIVDQYMQGRTAGEIAQRLGISLAAVKSRLMRARTTLYRSPALRRACTTNLAGAPSESRRRKSTRKDNQCSHIAS